MRTFFGEFLRAYALYRFCIYMTDGAKRRAKYMLLKNKMSLSENVSACPLSLRIVLTVQQQESATNQPVSLIARTFQAIKSFNHCSDSPCSYHFPCCLI